MRLRPWRIPSATDSLLIIKRDGIGDMVNAIPGLLRAAEQVPNFTLWANAAPATVATHALPETVSVVSASPRKRFTHVVALRHDRTTLHFALRYLPQSYLDRGWFRWRHRNEGHPHDQQFNTQMLAVALGVTGPQPTAVFLPNLTPAPEVAPYAVLHAGAKSELRRWPIERYLRLAQRLVTELNLQVHWIGTHEDRWAEPHLSSAQNPGFHNRIGQLSLTETLGLLAGAQLFIGNESGPLHLASASGTPSVGVFGPGEPTVFYPLGAHTRVLHEVLACNPCNQRTCLYPTNPCIGRVSEAAVWGAVEELLGPLYPSNPD